MRRLLVLLGCLCALVVSIVIPCYAYAEPDQLNVMLVSDKDSYAQGDVATFTVKVENSSTRTAEGVTYSVNLPEGMRVADESSASGGVGTLEPGESFSTSIKAIVEVSEVDVGTPGLNTGASGSDLNAPGADAEAIPATGEAAPVVLKIAVAVGATLVAGAFVIKKRFGIGALALVLALVTGGVLFLPTSRALASEQRSETTASCQFELNGEAQAASLAVGFTFVSGAQAVDPDEPNTMTRAEWVARLLEGTGATYVEDATAPFGDISGHQYETAIKTAYALGFLPDSGSTFSPDEVATRDFVFSTSVLSAGFSDDGAALEASDANDADHPGLLAIALDVGLAQLDADNNIRPQEPFAVDEVEELIGLIRDLSGTTVGGDGGYDYVLQDGVVEVDGYQFDGLSSSFTFDGERFDIAVGTKVALQATESNPYGAAGTVTSVTQNSDGTVTATFEQATDPSQIFVSLRASQTGVVIDSSMLVQFEQNQSSYAIQPRLGTDGEWEPEDGALEDGFYVSLDDSGSYVSGSLSVSPTLGYDIEWSLFGGLKKCDLDLSGEVGIEAKAHVQNNNAGKDVEVLRAKAPLGWGFSIDVPIYLHVTMEGDLEATVDYTMSTSIRLVNDHWQTKDDSDFSTELSAALHMRLGGKVGAEFKWFEIQIVDAAVEAGVDGSAKTTVRETGMVCADLSGYAYAGAEAGLKTDYLVWLGWTIDKDIITESNSPFKFKWHWEDGVQVPECTYGKDDPENPDEPGGGEGATGVIDPNFDGIPEQVDEGWGNEPIWTTSEDGKKAEISEPFYLEAGTTLTIRAGENCRWRGMFGSDGNTLVREIYSYDDSESSIKMSQGIYMFPWDMGDYGSITLEVLSGRIKVWDLEGWSIETGTEEQHPVRPMLSFGSCETVEYPVVLSATSVTMHVGDTYQLSASQTVQDIYAEMGCEYDRGTDFEWTSEDASVAAIDDSGLITANDVGTTYVRVSYGKEPNGFSRLCRVTVTE